MTRPLRVQSQARRAGRIYRAGDESATQTARQMNELSDGYWLADYDAEREAMNALEHIG